jgi:hypothetical protein
MDPISGVVGKEAGKEVAASAWNWLRRLFTRFGDLKKENEGLKAQLDKKAEFERRKAELICYPEDDCLYQNKDGTGPYYCPLCLGADGKFIPVTHGTPGTYYCKLHDHYFETKQYRERPRRIGPVKLSGRHSHSWMGS